MQKLRENNLKLQFEKCEFLRKKIIYLGLIISENGISPDPSKLTAIKEYPTTTKVKDIQSFIGLVGYYRKVIKDFSKIAKLLTMLTKKIEKFEWIIEQQNVFNNVKEKLMTAPVLTYPDFTREFIITTLQHRAKLTELKTQLQKMNNKLQDSDQKFFSQKQFIYHMATSRLITALVKYYSVCNCKGKK